MNIIDSIVSPCQPCTAYDLIVKAWQGDGKAMVKGKLGRGGGCTGWVATRPWGIYTHIHHNNINIYTVDNKHTDHKRK